MQQVVTITVKHSMNSRKSMSVLQYDYLEVLMSPPPWQIVSGWMEQMGSVSWMWTLYQAPIFVFGVTSLGKFAASAVILCGLQGD